MYVSRKAEEYFNLIRQQFPVVIVTGPRQSGKTTFVKHQCSDLPYVSLEDPDIRSMVKDDPKGFLAQYAKGVIIDEFQRVPDLVSYLQAIVDDNKSNGLFILTGSQQFMMMESVSQSLAGRAGLVDLLPFELGEMTQQGRSIEQDWVTGTYPRVIVDGQDPKLMYRNYVATYVERDVRQITNIRDLSQFERFIELCAGQIGQIVNASTLAVEVGVSVPTIQHWLSILEASYLIYFLRPFSTNRRKSLVKSPKLYFVDTGLASYLLGINDSDIWKTHPLRGNMYENYVISELWKQTRHAGERYPFYFYRDHHGKEVDLLMNPYGTHWVACEVKSTSTFNSRLVHQLEWLRHSGIIPIKDFFLIYQAKQPIVYKETKCINMSDIKSVWAS
ncbi:MAG: ATP-binding protein, partial [Candidatus Margulisiibacteriota bacterium]